MQRVAIALLQMPQDHQAALTGGYAGWTVPLDRQPVHRLLERLHLPRFDRFSRFTLRDAVARYWPTLLLGGGVLVVMAVLTLWVLRLNRRLQRAKARLEQRHELILNSVAEGIYGVDLDGRTTFANVAMERLTGWRADEVIGKNQHELLHHTHADGSPHPAHERPVYATFRDGRPRYVDDGVPPRRTPGRQPCVQPCCTSDEGRPLEAAVQAAASNHPRLLPLRGAVVSALRNGRARPGQVRTVESNVSEPLMTCRKRRDDAKAGGSR